MKKKTFATDSRSKQVSIVYVNFDTIFWVFYDNNNDDDDAILLLLLLRYLPTKSKVYQNVSFLVLQRKNIIFATNFNHQSYSKYKRRNVTRILLVSVFLLSFAFAASEMITMCTKRAFY